MSVADWVKSIGASSNGLLSSVRPKLRTTSSLLLDIISRSSRNVIREIEEFAVDLHRRLREVIRRYEETKEPATLEATLTHRLRNSMTLLQISRRLSDLCTGLTTLGDREQAQQTDTVRCAMLDVTGPITKLSTENDRGR